MKRISYIWLLLVMICLPAFSQVNGVNSFGYSSNFKTWQARMDSSLADTLWVTGTDTVYTEVLQTWPYMTCGAEVGDSSSTDSSGYKVNMYQWVYYRTNSTYSDSDLGKFVFVKSLTWNGTSELLVNDSTIDAAGTYLSSITSSPIFSAPLFRLEIIGTAKNKKSGAGSWIKLYLSAWGG